MFREASTLLRRTRDVRSKRLRRPARQSHGPRHAEPAPRVLAGPLLAVPLTEIALSPILDEEDLVHFGGKHLQGTGRDLARRTRLVIDSVIDNKHSLTDEDALQLVEASHDLLQLSSAFLYPAGFLLAGAGIYAGLNGEPLRRETAKWIAEGSQSPAVSAFVITHMLSLAADPMGWLPRANARYAPVTRAIDRRMHAAGIATWEQAILMAFADEAPLPATLLAGREVFFFTGEPRRSSAESAAESLRELGPSEIRTFYLRKGTEGPSSFPPNALVVVDIRLLGHSQSGMIADRAERSGAQFLAVRTGKGGLARMVAAALQ